MQHTGTPALFQRSAHEHAGVRGIGGAFEPMEDDEKRARARQFIAGDQPVNGGRVAIGQIKFLPP
jgi:hypothetical protein